MEIIKRSSDYALRGLVYMAVFPSGTVFDVSSIARRLDIPSAFLYKIFRKLADKKIVCSHRGVRGGFSLLKNTGNLSVRKIIEIIQGPVWFNKCLVKKNNCSQQDKCSLNINLALIQKKLFNIIDKLTIKKLARETKFNPASSRPRYLPGQAGFLKLQG